MPLICKHDVFVCKSKPLIRKSYSKPWHMERFRYFGVYKYSLCTFRIKIRTIFIIFLLFETIIISVEEILFCLLLLMLFRIHILRSERAVVSLTGPEVKTIENFWLWLKFLMCKLLIYYYQINRNRIDEVDTPFCYP